MVISPVLRQLFMDKISLREYSQGVLPDFDDVKRRLFLLERSLNRNLPDHYYKNAEDNSLEGIKTFEELMSEGLIKLSTAHLELRDGIIIINTKALDDWQILLTLSSPLLHVSSAIFKYGNFLHGNRNAEYLLDFAEQYIAPNAHITALPSPFFNQMESLTADQGLYDLHIHLNGSTETDVLWQDIIRQPIAVYRIIQGEYNNRHSREKVREQIEAEDSELTPYLFYRRLRTAQRLRKLMVCRIFNQSNGHEFDFAEFMRIDSIYEYDMPRIVNHPMEKIFEGKLTPYSKEMDICLESLMYILVIDEIKKNNNKQLAHVFHFYLLILGFVNRFIVQQMHQNGFDQFQKITVNGFRDFSEKEYFNRFRQLHGNRKRNLKHLEGRFSPKSEVAKNFKQLMEIKKGFDKFQNEEESNSFRLQLIAHLIKKPDDYKVEEQNAFSLRIRHHKNRLDYYKTARALTILHEQKKFSSLLVGIDAAANELDTPPEVFAPVYRYLRRKDFQHFTYHVGEDFHHLIGGLRAIYEAVDFLDLRSGDRIGHATAAGIDPGLWHKNIGDTFYISRGEWVDDLTFLYYFINEHSDLELRALLPHIQDKIISIGKEVYCIDYPPHIYLRAWQYRKHCPFHLLFPEETARNYGCWSTREWELCHALQKDTEAIDLLKRYHTNMYKERYNKKIKVSTLGLLNNSTAYLLKLQNIILDYLHKKEIIIEVLPTSNVRISFYQGYEEHHIWRWLGLKDMVEGMALPTLVLGSDDPGIFATNIYNEYCHIYNHLTKDHHLSHVDAGNKMNDLNENSKVYYFRSDAK